MAEQLICNQQVDGSTPFTSSKFNIYGGIPERPKGADCKSVVTDFAGPNPASPTIKKTLTFRVGVFLILREAGTRQASAKRTLSRIPQLQSGCGILRNAEKRVSVKTFAERIL